MAEYEARAAEQMRSNQAQGGQDAGYLARLKGQMWAQEDLGLAQGRPARGLNAFERTPGWAHARGGELSSPERYETRKWTFEQLQPGAAPTPVGVLPERVDLSRLKFATRTRRQAPGGADSKPRRQATMMWTQGEAGFDDAVLGQEVDRFYQWVKAQHAMVDPIASIEPSMRALRRNGILDEDFRVADEDDLDALLHDVARSGRIEVYAEAASTHAGAMLASSGLLAANEVKLMRHAAQMNHLGSRIGALEVSLRGARSAILSHYAQRAVKAEERAVAGLIRERDNMLRWIDGLTGLVTGWASILQSMNGPAGGGSSASRGGGAASMVASVARLVVHQTYEAEIDEAHSRIGLLRQQADALEADALRAHVEAVSAELSGYVELVRSMRLTTHELQHLRVAGYSRFGAAAAEAVGAMGPGRQTRDGGPFSGEGPPSMGRIQRLFANIRFYDDITSMVARARWPQMTGEVPLSGFLFWSDEAGVLADVGEEAAKLRWWQERTEAVNSLASRVRQTVASLGSNSRSTR